MGEKTQTLIELQMMTFSKADYNTELGIQYDILIYI